jgi:hypothetical protein
MMAVPLYIQGRMVTWSHELNGTHLARADGGPLAIVVSCDVVVEA